MTTIETRPDLQVVPAPESEGQTEPVLLVGLQPSAELLEQAADFKKPCYLVVVSSVEQLDTRRYNQDRDEYETENVTRYRQRAAYVFPMTLRQSQYVTFRKPGRHRISACIVEAKSNASQLYNVESKNFSVIDDETGALKCDQQLPEGVQLAEAHAEVDVSPDLFAPPPTGWRRNLVERFARNQGIDECNFFWRSVGAIILTGILFAIGLVLRPLLLLTAMLMLRYDIKYRKLWAFFPWELWRSAGASAWFESRDGTDREYQSGLKKILPFISPPAWLAYTAIFFAIPSLVYGVVNIPWDDSQPDGRGNFADWGYWETFGIVYKWLAVVALIVSTAAGVFLTVMFIVGRIRNKPIPPKVQQAKQQSARQYRLEQLRQNTVEITAVNAIPQTAQRGLWLKRFKREHCRPYITQ